MGGLCSILQKLFVFCLFVISVVTIFRFDSYSVTQSLIFQDVRNTKVDFAKDVRNFAFGFQWERKVVDMIDNEYVSIEYIHQTKLSTTEKIIDHLEPEECEETGHLSQYYTPKEIVKKYGHVYCPSPLNEEQYL